MRRRISQPRFVLTIAVACLALLLVADATAGAAGWVSATPPATAANGPSGAVVAVDPAGDAIAAWTDDDGGTQSLVVATRPAGGPWSAPAPIASDVGVDAPAVTLDAAGNATVVWIESPDGSAFAAHARRRDAASGTWGATQDFPVGDVANVADPLTQVRADALGDVVAAWVEHDGTTGVASVHAAVADAAGSWSAPSTLSDPADASVSFDRPQIAPDAGGGALVGWTAQRVADPFDSVVQTSTHLGGGSWPASPDELVSSSDAIAPLRLVGVAGGEAAATWTQGSPPTLWGAYRLNGNWSVDSLSDDVATACVPLQALGADAGGGATAVWKAASTGGLEAMPLTAGGPEAETTVFSPSGEIVEDAAVDHGTVVLVAHASGTDTDELLASRRSSGGGGWSAPALVASAAAGTSLAGPGVATDAAGDALAGWTATDGLGVKSVAAAAFQTSAPTLSAVSVPASGTAGAQLAVSASARSTFAPIAQTSWDFGDRSPAVGGGAAAHAYASAGTYTVTVTVTDAAGNATQATRQVAIAAAPVATPPPPTPPARTPPTPAALVRPRIGGAPGGVLVLGRRARTLKLLVRNANAVSLTGSAMLARPRSGRRAALTLASRHRVRYAAGRRTTLALTLSDQALRALKRASGFRLPVRVTLQLRAADGRRVGATLTATLDAAARFDAGRAPTATAHTSC
jgi:PKD domain